jgi:hypothetical protein
MKVLRVLLNSPLSLTALLGAALGGIKSVSLHKSPPTLVIHVHSFWYKTWRKKNKGVRGSAMGNVVLLGEKLLPKDFEHELIHVEQAMKYPLIQPILYWVEIKRHGYRDNKYEIEAYKKAGNTYLEK